jgi:hypothetical protein
MNATQFIALLCLYLAVVAFNFLSGRFARPPEHLAKAKPNRQEILRQRSKVYLAAFSLANVLVMACGVFGLLGMFLFWRFSPWVFGGAVIGKILLFRLPFWRVSSGLESMLSELELFLDGVILTLALFGPARHLFCPVT